MMRPHRTLRSLACLLGLLAALALAARPAAAAPAECLGDGRLDVLTLNVLFGIDPSDPAPIPSLAERLTTLAGALETLRDQGLVIDVLVVQELTDGALAGLVGGLPDSDRFLQAALAGVGDYRFVSAPEAGLPGIFVTKNATYVLTPCGISTALVKFLPVAESINLFGLDLPITRNVLMTRVDVPGHRDVNVYNTHLCADCPAFARGEQIESLLGFVGSVERLFRFFTRRTSPVVLGGDFNLDRFRDNASLGQYDRIIQAGFDDAYGLGQGLDVSTLCESLDEHCTVAVSDFDTGTARRIDYVFTRSLRGNVVDSEVLFNTTIDPDEPSVSDHAGVRIGIVLQ